MSPNSAAPEKAPDYTINLRDDQGRLWPAQVYLESRWPEKLSFHPDECMITLKWDGGDLRAGSWDYFEALSSIRKQLAERKLMPLCYGASRLVILSRMLRDMNEGLMAYKILPDNTVSTEQVVNIFETEPELEPVLVEEQAQFQQAWIQTNSRK